MDRVLARKEKKEGKRAMRRKLVILMTDNNLLQTYFQEWLALTGTKHSFANFMESRLKRDGHLC